MPRVITMLPLSEQGSGVFSTSSKCTSSVYPCDSTSTPDFSDEERQDQGGKGTGSKSSSNGVKKPRISEPQSWTH